ncbi:hypothetical protein FEM03_05480 [Phragmitibacter flavus]|uniref:DUF3592 domain-containing protein n=1 Tax=Phragmitibacter flavus TaxID=2576071 RepID=A0A5R8KGZ9_9BACT|nr:DUF3592 domain-containing protein [Phragmitibacter flavus]TLD71594.1 hypothetical protein FEM03_05480 [Phragmitibacter flavus]
MDFLFEWIGLILNWLAVLMEWSLRLSPIIGIATLVIAIHKHRARILHLRTSEVVEGEVIELESSDEDPVYAWVKVSLPDGTEETMRSTFASSPPAFAVGQRIKVHFNSSAKPRLLINHLFEKWGIIGLLYVTASGCMVAAWLLPHSLDSDFFDQIRRAISH